MSLATKLQLRSGQRLAVVNPPPAVALGVPEDDVHDDPATAGAVLLFVRTAADLNEQGEVAVAAARRDDLSWVAYPKAGQLGTDLNRDSLAAHLRERGVRPVRQVSIDDVWSALRFRPAT